MHGQQNIKRRIGRSVKWT